MQQQNIKYISVKIFCMNETIESSNCFHLAGQNSHDHQTDEKNVVKCKGCFKIPKASNITRATDMAADWKLSRCKRWL
jgi:hypothetical protein